MPTVTTGVTKIIITSTIRHPSMDGLEDSAYKAKVKPSLRSSTVLEDPITASTF